MRVQCMVRQGMFLAFLMRIVQLLHFPCDQSLDSFRRAICHILLGPLNIHIRHARFTRLDRVIKYGKLRVEHLVPNKEMALATRYPSLQLGTRATAVKEQCEQVGRGRFVHLACW